MWNYIEAANWAAHSKEKQGYYKVKRFFLENYTRELIEKINVFARERFMQLDSRLNAYEAEHGRVGTYSGDDSYGDMIDHVVGLGEEYFNSVIANPALLNDLDFVESFSYSFPSPNDFAALEPSYHQDRAVNAITELARIFRENKPSVSDIETMRQMLNRFAFMAAGDFPEAVRGFNDKRYDEYYKFDSNDQMAMFSNYLKDLQQTM